MFACIIIMYLQLGQIELGADVILIQFSVRWYSDNWQS